MNSIILIIPYFGKWPVWFDAYLCSIENNPTINWLCPTDCEIPKKHPENITFLSTSLLELNKHINSVVDANVPLNHIKFCDLKPAYGDIFKEHIASYDFWGICDMDIVWGNIRKFITDDLLEKYDIISSLENMISGHFTIFKNHEKNLYIYKNEGRHKEVFVSSKHLRYDEVGFTNIVSKLEKEGQIKVFWDEKLIQSGIKSEMHQEYFLDRWLYKNGSVYDLYDINKKEYMYLHFINWKVTMKFCEIDYLDQPKQFYISYNGVHYKINSSIVKSFNGFKVFFNGYWLQQYFRIKKHRLKSLVKRINRKVKSIIKN